MGERPWAKDALDCQLVGRSNGNLAIKVCDDREDVRGWSLWLRYRHTSPAMVTFTVTKSMEQAGSAPGAIPNNGKGSTMGHIAVLPNDGKVVKDPRRAVLLAYRPPLPNETTKSGRGQWTFNVRLSDVFFPLDGLEITCS